MAKKKKVVHLVSNKKLKPFWAIVIKNKDGSVVGRKSIVNGQVLIFEKKTDANKFCVKGIGEMVIKATIGLIK